ncbi:hypothetical protein EVAR_74221_1 [Eumeta japonica]|uniref:Uncharacterized protein n=1 Tax=Eumeta variegata TaxID=151549 RepID=A0A4C1SEM7_EUMVA|nr:hypothetical protein EVAR_74221_1 [Eumeta japonica]
MTPIHHQQMSPIRKKSESPTQSKRVDKTPTTPANLTPIDETRALDLTQAVNGVNGDQLTPENPISQDEGSKVVKKSIEATQIAPGVVDTTLVNDTSALGTGLTAAEVLDRARTRFDKFWGKKEENDNV